MPARKKAAPEKPAVIPDLKTDAQAAEEIARNIRAISAGMRALRNTSLTNETVVFLISHAAKVPQRTVKKTLEAMDNLEAMYCKRAPAK